MDTEVRQTLQEDHLRSIPDLSRLAKRFQRQVATLEDVVRAYQVVIRLPGLIEALDAIQDDRHRDLIQSTYVQPLQVVQSSCNKAIDSRLIMRIWPNCRRWSKLLLI